MVNTDDLQMVLREETDLEWTVAEDKPDLKRFNAVSFQFTLAYRSGKDNWRISFEDAASGDEEALGPIDTDNLESEFRGFVSETYNDHKL